MARKRDGFVPIGDLDLDMPGVPVPTPRAAAITARGRRVSYSRPCLRTRQK